MSAAGRTKRLILACVVAAQALACSDPAVRKHQFFERGQVLAAGGKDKEAILAYRNALKADPNYAEAHFALAAAYARVDDSVNAYRSYQRAADLLPDNVEVQLGAAKFLLNAGQYQDARSRATRAVEIDPSSAAAHMLLGSALAGSKDVAGAIAQVQEAIDLAPDSISGYTGMGSLLLTQGRVAEAQTQFEKAVATDPKSADARVALAAYHWSTGDLRKAEAVLRAAIGLAPDNAIANRAMALLLMTTGRGIDAEPFLKTVSRTLGTADAELPLADYYVRGGRVAEARQILERAAAAGNAPAIVRLARLDFAENQPQSAHDRIDALLARQPSNSEALIAKGRWLLRSGKADEALERGGVATERDPGNAAAHLLVADARMALGQQAHAANSYRDVLRLNPRAAAAHTALARINLAEGNAASAVDFARGGLLNEPGRDEARILLARGLIQQREFKRAEEELAILTARRPADPVVMALRGTLLLRKGDRSQAQALFERALQQDALNVDALGGLTSIDAATGRIEQARQRLAQALEKAPSSIPLLMLTARADLQAGDFAAGERRARAVIDLDPAQLKAYELLGAAYIRQQKLDAALAEFEQVVQKEPRSIGALTVIGMIHEAGGRPHEAEKAYQRALQADARAAVAGNNLAYLLAQRGDNLQYALILARDAVSMRGDDPVALDTLGWVHLKKGEASQAIEPLGKAAKLAPDNPTYHFHLGLAYLEIDDRPRARASLQRALQLNASFPGAQEARERLRGLD
jgi:tetratricopeptide (TPR) repeat protein